MKPQIRYEPIPDQSPLYITAEELEQLIEKLRPLLSEEKPIKVIQINDQ